MITRITKMIPKMYYVVDGVKFDANELLGVLDDIANAHDSWVSETETNWMCTEKLFDLGYIDRKCIDYKGVLYHDTEDKKASALFNEILKM